MNIVIYSHDFLPSVGGVQTYVFELASGLTEANASDSDDHRQSVTVITNTRAQAADENRWAFEVVRRPTLAKLIQMVRGADVVHLAGPTLLPMILGLAFHKPIIVEHHGYQAVCPNGLLFLGTQHRVCPGHFMAGRYWDCVRCNSKDMGLLGSVRAVLLEFPRRLACRFVAVNAPITDHVGRRIGLPRTKTIFYGIRDPGPAPLSVNGDTIQIGYVGRLVKEKGAPMLVEAAKRLQDEGFSFHMTFIGGGPLRETLEADARELGLDGRLSFTGDLAGADLESAVRPLHIVVMPSMCEETAGLAAIEQMMRSRLVIASDIGGLSEVVGDAGLKFTPGDSAALCACLRRVFRDPSLLTSLGSSARERALKLFTRNDMIKAHRAIYNKMVAR